MSKKTWPMAAQKRIAELEVDVVAAKKRRIFYQDLVYQACRLLDKTQTPCPDCTIDQVVPRIEELQARVYDHSIAFDLAKARADKAEARIAELEAEVARPHAFHEKTKRICKNAGLAAKDWCERAQKRGKRIAELELEIQAWDSTVGGMQKDYERLEAENAKLREALDGEILLRKITDAAIEKLKLAALSEQEGEDEQE